MSDRRTMDGLRGHDLVWHSWPPGDCFDNLALRPRAGNISSDMRAGRRARRLRPAAQKFD